MTGPRLRKHEELEIPNDDPWKADKLGRKDLGLHLTRVLETITQPFVIGLLRALVVALVVCTATALSARAEAQFETSPRAAEDFIDASFGTVERGTLTRWEREVRISLRGSLQGADWLHLKNFLALLQSSSNFRFTFSDSSPNFVVIFAIHKSGRVPSLLAVFREFAGNDAKAGALLAQSTYLLAEECARAVVRDNDGRLALYVAVVSTRLDAIARRQCMNLHTMHGIGFGHYNSSNLARRSRRELGPADLEVARLLYSHRVRAGASREEVRRFLKVK